jgi:hypothetical protein
MYGEKKSENLKVDYSVRFGLLGKYSKSSFLRTLTSTQEDLIIRNFSFGKVRIENILKFR